MNCGDAFFIDDEEGSKEHLHIVLTKPTADQEVITVPICTRYRWSEVLVCLEAGDHPFIRHPSVVAFRYARIRKCSLIDRAIECGNARWHRDPVSDEILRRIQLALPESDFVPNDVRAFIVNSAHISKIS